MTIYKNPPSLPQKLLSFFAGPNFREEIVGDLFEQFQQRPMKNSENILWYWQQVLLSAPHLVSTRIRTASRESMISEVMFIASALIYITLWEKGISEVAWPIARHLNAFLNLSSVFTCKSIYIFLYGSGVLFALFAASYWIKAYGKNQLFAYTHYVLLGLLVTLPVVIYIIWPNPYDDFLGFRLAQLSVVWMVLIGYFVLTRHRTGFTYLS